MKKIIIYFIAIKCPLFPGIYDQTTCEEHKGHTWVADICVSVNDEPKNFYEAFYTCKQRNVLLAKVPSSEVNAAILSHLSSDVSYYFLLTGQTILFSDCKISILCLFCN